MRFEEYGDSLKGKVISVDFDGVLCRPAWPCIGEENDLALSWVRQAVQEGARIILNTCRTGRMLSDAIEWCRARGIEFDAVNENLPERIRQYNGDCRKISADFYIDDKAICIPGLTLRCIP